MIQLKGVCKSFVTPTDEVRVLSNADLAVLPGEFVCVLGESGSGKSTLLNIIAGLETFDVGSVQVSGLDLATATDAAKCDHRLKRVGMIFQDNNLIVEFTAIENVMLPLVVQKIPHQQASDRAKAALEQVGIGDLANRYPLEMSGGQRQRIGIARALAIGGDVLLCDEPTGALDEANSKQLFQLLADLAEKKNLAIVLCTHDLHALAYCTRTLRMTDKSLAPFVAEVGA